MNVLQNLFHKAFLRQTRRGTSVAANRRGGRRVGRSLAARRRRGPSAGEKTPATPMPTRDVSLVCRSGPRGLSPIHPERPTERHHRANSTAPQDWGSFSCPSSHSSGALPASRPRLQLQAPPPRPAPAVSSFPRGRWHAIRQAEPIAEGVDTLITLNNVIFRR